MYRADVIDLIAEDPVAHGFFEAVTEVHRTVFCEVRSVTRNEAYQARSVNLFPEYVFKLSLEDEYKGEKHCIYKNILYDVIRTYMLDDGIELTVQRSEANG